MKKGKGLLSVVVLIAVFFAGYKMGQTGFGLQEKKTDARRTIEETIADFEEAYNTGDFEKLLSCMSVERSKFLSSFLSFIGSGASKLLGLDISQSLMNTIWSLGAQSSKMHLTIQNIVYTGDAAADVFLTVAYEGGEVYYEQMGVDGVSAKMNMVLENGDWIITSDFIPVDQ